MHLESLTFPHIYVGPEIAHPHFLSVRNATAEKPSHKVTPTRAL